MIVGVVGKANVGKSSFFSAATMENVPIANYPFTTIEPNKGTTFVKVPCACKTLGVKCNPQNSACVDGVRFIPVQLLDVAGLVPGAHEGRGLGNKLLDDLRQADALVHVVDMSGSTDEEGRPCVPGTRDPKEDILFLEEEIDYWLLNILKKHWPKVSKAKNSEEMVAELVGIFAGLKITEAEVLKVMDKKALTGKENDGELLAFLKELRKISKPMIIAANKIDLAPAEENYGRIKKEFPNLIIIPTYADGELALRKADKAGLIKYVPGAPGFEMSSALGDNQKTALGFIRDNVLGKFGSTGVQRVIDKAVFELLDMIAVYPVEDEHKYTDNKGNVLPDAILVKKGATAKDLAFKIHTDIGKNFIAAQDVKTHMKIGKDHPLKDGDVIKIYTAAR